MIDIIQQNKPALIAELEKAGAKFKGNSCTCPFHDDKNPSAGVYQGQDSVWRFKCQVCGIGGDIFDMQAKITGRSLNDVLRRDNGKVTKTQAFKTMADLRLAVSKGGDIENEYTYTNPTTKQAEVIVFRIKTDKGKVFKLAHPVSGGFTFGATAKPWPLYNRSRVQQAKAVIVVEGEKVVHALQTYGFIATTNLCGAGKAAYADWSILAGKNIILWPDNDLVGTNHIADVAAILKQLDPPAKISVVNPGDLGLPNKSDAVDFIEKYKTLEPEGIKALIRKVLVKARPHSIAAEVGGLIEDTITGKHEGIKWPWPKLSNLTQALLPKMVTLICGDPGATKSFLLLESLIHWHKKGIRVAAFMLEDDRQFHLLRALAQIEENSNLCNFEWIKENPEESRAAYRRHEHFLDGFGKCIDTAPVKQQTLNNLSAWVEEKAKAGFRIIAIDPVTAAQPTEKPWISDATFLTEVKIIVRNYGASLILVTHSKKGNRSGCTLDDIAGGAAYQRFAHSVIWIERHQQRQLKRIKTDCGTTDIEINRTVHLAKARNGTGQGLQLGYIFDGATLLLAEQGIVLPKQKAK